jgi:hypothetical protein
MVNEQMKKTKKKLKSLLIGFGINAIFLIFCAFLYQTFYIKLISEGYTFLGSFYFFICETLFVPLIFLLFKKYYECLGGLLGITGYFLIFIPLSMMLGGG